LLRLAGGRPRFSRNRPEEDVTYAIIKLAGKQYRVREGERLLVDRLPESEGSTISPAVLLVGGDGDPAIAPSDVMVTARVLGAAKGPKIRIGKYKKRTGYRRHTGFRASLTQIEIESIGAKRSRRSASPKIDEEASRPSAAPSAGPRAPGAPEGYAELTIAQLKTAAGSWDLDQLRAALAFEHEHAKRKGALAALEAVIAEKEGES
jgi:large subunit ribosomal protein L21